jgi:DNA-binding NarL/FixJ family response regulator
MKESHVLVCQGDCVLDVSIDSFLNAKEGIRVISVSPENDEELIDLVEHHKPDIVVFGEWLTNRLESIVVRLFKLQPQLRVIVVSGDHNLLRVYYKRDIWLESGADLIHVIQTA